MYIVHTYVSFFLVDPMFQNTYVFPLLSDVFEVAHMFSHAEVKSCHSEYFDKITVDIGPLR